MERVRKLLTQVSTLTLATTDLNGIPHATPVYFVASDKDHLFFFSDETSLHTQHINQNSQAAAAIYPECGGWQDIKGLQLRGKVHLVESTDTWNIVWELYQLKFPFVGSLKSIVARNKMYAFIPSWIRLVDNSQGFGFKREWNIP